MPSEKILENIMEILVIWLSLSPTCELTFTANCCYNRGKRKF